MDDTGQAYNSGITFSADTGQVETSGMVSLVDTEQADSRMSSLADAEQAEEVEVGGREGTSKTSAICCWATISVQDDKTGMVLDD